MDHYNQSQAQVYLTHPYPGGSPNYTQQQQQQQQPNTALYVTNIPSNPNYDIRPYTQPYEQYQSPPYFIPSPAPVRDQIVPGGSHSTLSNLSDPMGVDPSPSIVRFINPPLMPENQMPVKNNSPPALVINEQPKNAFRFRYNCEGSSHGALLGAKSEKGRKSYPSVSVENYFGHAVVVASLVPPKSEDPHPFSLTGKGVQNGLYMNVIRDGIQQGVEVRLKDLSILHVKKQEVMTALQHKYAVEYFIQQHGIYAYMNSSDAYNKKNMTSGDDEHDESQKSFGANLYQRMRPEDRKVFKERAIKACEQQQPLTTVRLCFRGYLFDQKGQLIQQIGPTFSCAITDTKNCPSLKICKIDKCVGSVKGHDNVFLLCDKVSRDDIEVVFEEEKDGNVVWTGKGEFQPSEVHHQVAIVFTTPAYRGNSTCESIQCCIKLRKPSTLEESNAITFRYLPDEMTKGYLGSKRKRMSESPYMPNKSQPSQLSYTQASFDPAYQLIAASTVPVSDGYMLNQTDPNMTTSLMLSESESALLSSFPDILNLHALSSEAADLLAQDLNLYSDKDTSVFMPEEYTHDGRYDVTERDGPAAPPKEKPEVKESAEIPQKELPVETKPTGRNPLHIARDMSQCAQRMMNRQYKAVQKYAYTGDVRSLLQPLLPYFYLHEHTQSDTLLHTALASQQIAALKAMLSLLRAHRKHASIVVNMSNGCKHTPLHFAVSLDQPEAVRELLEAGADPFKFDVYGNSSFHVAASRGNAECLSALIDYVTGVNATGKLPFDLCPDVFNFDGKTPLHLSIETEGVFECCGLLLMGGADLNSQEELEGNTLLHYAVINNSLSLCRYLLSQHGREIDIDAVTHSGDTPLFLALMNSRIDIAACLVSAGASVDVPNSTGQTVESLCEDTPALRGFLQECATGGNKPVSCSDLYSLKQRTISQLGGLLDGDKCRELATQLDIETEQFAHSSEQRTRALISAYREKEGTVSGLAQALENIDCSQGANIILSNK